jgi:cob(I)alamin adenosyltransferase
VTRHAGDTGETSLYGGARVPKSDARIEALGDVDELNSTIGVVLTLCADTPQHERLTWVQERLFRMGADLANPAGRSGGDAIGRTDVETLDRWLQDARDGLPQLRHFVMPGGTPSAAATQVARAVCRRAERSACRLDQAHSVNPDVLAFLNRLSDVLFELARQFNDRAGSRDVEWLGPRDRAEDPAGE